MLFDELQLDKLCAKKLSKTNVLKHKSTSEAVVSYSLHVQQTVVMHVVHDILCVSAAPATGPASSTRPCAGVQTGWQYNRMYVHVIHRQSCYIGGNCILLVLLFGWYRLHDTHLSHCSFVR